MIYTPGIYYDIPDKTYRDADGVSQSELKVLERSAKHFLEKSEPEVDEDDDEKTSTALLLGRLTSSLAIQPDEPPWWTVKPKDLSFTTKEGKAWKAEHADEQVVTHAMFQKASKMATKLADDPEIGPIIAGSKCEVSIFSEVDTSHGSVTCKCRPDIVTSGTALIDLKTTRDARPDPFARFMRQYGYPIQAAFYLDRWNEQCAPEDKKFHFFLIAIESYAPFEFMFYQIDGEDIIVARNQYKQLLDQYAACRKLNQWDGYPRGIHKIKVY